MALRKARTQDLTWKSGSQLHRRSGWLKVVSVLSPVPQGFVTPPHALGFRALDPQQQELLSLLT